MHLLPIVVSILILLNLPISVLNQHVHWSCQILKLNSVSVLWPVPLTALNVNRMVVNANVKLMSLAKIVPDVLVAITTGPSAQNATVLVTPSVTKKLENVFVHQILLMTVCLAQLMHMDIITSLVVTNVNAQSKVLSIMTHHVTLKLVSVNVHQMLLDENAIDVKMVTMDIQTVKNVIVMNSVLLIHLSDNVTSSPVNANVKIMLRV